MPTAPAWSFTGRHGKGTESRGQAKRAPSAVPGPGAYSLPATLSVRSHTFGRRVARASGPETIDKLPIFYAETLPEVVTAKAPAFSLGRRSDTLVAKPLHRETPGPGAYPRCYRPSTAPAIKLGVRWKESTKRGGPGPGDYHLEKCNNANSRYATMPRVPKVSNPRFALSSKEKEAQKVPGPGSYYPEKSLGKGARSTVLRGRRQMARLGAPDLPHTYVCKYQHKGDFVECAGRWK